MRERCGPHGAHPGEGLKNENTAWWGGQIQTAFQRCVRHGCVTDRVRLVPSLSSWKGLLERKAGSVPCVVFRCGSLLSFGSEGSCPLLMASV